MSNIRITEKKRPGGIPVLENIRLNYEEVIFPKNNPVIRKVWDMSISDLQTTIGGVGSLLDGSGTTANGDAIDLGGTSIQDIDIDMDGGSLHFHISDGTVDTDDSHRFRIWNSSHNMEFNTKNSNADYGYFNMQPNGFDAGSYDDISNLGAYIDLSRTRQLYRTYNNTNTMDFRINPDGILMTGLKSGTSQVNASASVNELWRDTADNSIKIGV